MRYKFDVDHDRGLFLLRLDGRMGAQDMADLFQELAASPDRKPDQNVFCDLTGLERADLSFTQVMSLTRSRTGFYEQAKEVRVAILAPNDIGFGTARMYLALMQGFDGITADVFRDRAEAARFLAVAPETLRVP